MNIPKEHIKEALNYVTEIRDLKHVHFRDINKDIDSTNFQICTKVDFKEIKNTYPNVREMWGRIEDEKNIIYNFTSKTGSKYMIDDENNVYRLSDHWGAVATCEWTLEGRGELKESVFLSGEWEIGIANLKDFQIFRRKVARRKDIIINPEWLIKINIIKPIVQELKDLINHPEFSMLEIEDKRLIGGSYGKLKKIFA